MGDQRTELDESMQDEQNSPTTNEYKIVAKQLWVYIGLAIIILGTIGHVLSLLVLLGSRRMRSLSLSVYLVASAVSGLVALYVGLLRQILLRLDGYEKDLRAQTSDAGCRIHAALTYFSLQLFSWLQASVAVERVIAVWRPLQYKHWCTWKRNLIVVSAITVLLAAFNIIVIYSYTLDASEVCYPIHNFLFDRVYGSLDLVLYAVVPIAVMVPCNVATMIHIFRSAEYKRGTNAAFNNRRSSQFTVMLLVHNILCVVTTLPISIIFLMPDWDLQQGSEESTAISMEWTVFSFFQYIGTMLGFTVYSLLAQRFRQATRDLFCKGFNAKVSSLESASPSARSRRQSEAGIGKSHMKSGNTTCSESGSLVIRKESKEHKSNGIQ